MNNTTLHVDGMSCEHCVQSITEAVRAVPGVNEVHVDLKGQTVTMVYYEGQFNLDIAKQVIEEQGYTVKQ